MRSAVVWRVWACVVVLCSVKLKHNSHRKLTTQSTNTLNHVQEAENRKMMGGLRLI